MQHTEQLQNYVYFRELFTVSSLFFCIVFFCSPILPTSPHANCALTLSVEQVRMGLVVGILDQHRLRSPENGVLLEVPELEAVLADMYFAARRENMSDEDVDLNSELLLNFLLNAFDE